MFEKLFGGKKIKYDSDEPAIPDSEMMGKLNSAHADAEGVLLNGEVLTDNGTDEIQDEFKDNKVSEKKFHYGNRRKEDEGENWSVGVEKYLTKHEGSRKPEYKDLHSDWKEKGVFDEPLSKEEISDEHLDALMEQEQNTKFARDNFYPEEYDEDENQDLEKAA